MSDHLVHEAFGPPLPPMEAASAIGLGTVALLMAGLMPVLLGALADDGRLSSAGIGLCACLEGLTMGIVTALSGIVLKPVRLRWIGAAATLMLVAADLGTMWCSGGSVFLIRFLAGVPEGVLLWLAVSMIARTEVPERWSAVFFTSFVGAQLALALAYWAFVMPLWGTNGGYAVLALCSLPALGFAFLAPDSYAPLPKPEGESGAPPLRGWMALFGTLFLAGAAPAVGTYLFPLAHQAGLSADVGRFALWISLTAQVIAGLSATALAGRVHYFTMFVICAAGLLACWAVFDFSAPAWAFIAANFGAGYFAILLGPFLVPMTIEADPSRRAALLSASTQVLAGALAPLAASQLVDDKNAHGSLTVGVVTLVVGLAVIGALHMQASRARALARA
ncbi:MAG TPA: hypothetical protein VGF56_06880 [Rhizomicrobium sp.]